MCKTVIVYRWHSNSEPSLITAMENMGIQVISFEKEIKDYHADAVFAGDFLNILHKTNVDFVFSFDYFPIISSLCEINSIPYLSWIYDCPLYVLNSKTLVLNANYIFCFDRAYTLQLRQNGAKHCYHFPLGVSVELFQKAISMADKKKSNYCSEVSFVGNLYNGEKNRLRKACFSDYVKGYLEGVIESQGQLYGCNFIAETLSEGIVKEVATACELQMSDLYNFTYRQLVADAIGMEVSARDRERILAVAAENADLQIYTSSTLSERLLNNARVINRGYADYSSEMPLIFHESKINLNITSRTITSGMPQRVLDILACGGFCLTNYQPEIAEYFVDGEELVMYAGEEDAREKIVYYLEHEEERKAIAEKGYQKVLKQFTMEKRLQEIQNIWRSSNGT